MANVNVFTAVQNAMDNNDDFGPRGPFWISQTVGAFILSNSGGDIQAAKTADGGDTYDTTQTELDGSLGTLAAECDLAIPGGAGNNVNVVWGDDLDDDFTFAQFDISTGLFSGRVNLTTTSSGNPAGSWIARTRAGGYLAGMRQETSGLGLAWESAGGVTWSAIATPNEAAGVDFCLGISVNTDDLADGGILYLDVSANELSIKMWDDSAGTWTESADRMPLTKTDNSRTYDATTRLSDGQVIVAVVNATDSATGDINVYRINANSIVAPTITALADVVTDSPETGSVSVFIDQTNDDIYVVYGRGSNYAANLQVFYKKSVDGGATWGVETPYSEGTGSQWRVTSAGFMGAGGGVFLPAFHNQALDDLLVNVVNSVSISAPPDAGGGVTPSSGAEGDVVTIGGSHFQAGATVSFGGVAGTGVVVNGPGTEITVTVPAHPPGLVDVVVTNPDGKSDTITDGFSYVSSGAPTPLGGGPQPLQSTEREALRVLATARGFGAPSGGESQALEITLQQLLDEIRGFATPPIYPTDADRLFDLIFAALEVPRPRYVKRNAMLALIEANLPPI